MPICVIRDSSLDREFLLPSREKVPEGGMRGTARTSRPLIRRFAPPSPASGEEGPASVGPKWAYRSGSARFGIRRRHYPRWRRTSCPTLARGQDDPGRERGHEGLRGTARAGTHGVRRRLARGMMGSPWLGPTSSPAPRLCVVYKTLPPSLSIVHAVLRDHLPWPFRPPGERPCSILSSSSWVSRSSA